MENCRDRCVVRPHFPLELVLPQVHLILSYFSMRGDRVLSVFAYVRDVCLCISVFVCVGVHWLSAVCVCEMCLILCVMSTLITELIGYLVVVEAAFYA